MLIVDFFNKTYNPLRTFFNKMLNDLSLQKTCESMDHKTIINPDAECGTSTNKPDQKMLSMDTDDQLDIILDSNIADDEGDSPKKKRK